MQTENAVAAVLPDRVHARAVVEELQQRGIEREQLARALDHGERHLIDVNGDALWARSVILGMIVGAPIGSAVSYGLVAFGTAIAGGNAGDALVPGLLAGSFLGVVLGGAFGIGSAHRRLEMVELWSEVELTGDQVLIVIHSDDRRDEIHQIIYSHPAKEPDLHTELAA